MDEEMIYNCEHSWWDLDFMERGEGIACSECGQMWPLVDEDGTQNLDNLPDLVQTIWQSSKQAISELRLRMQELELVISEKLKLDPCDICEKWFAQETILKVGVHTICETDVGNFVQTHIEEIEDIEVSIVPWFIKEQRKALENGDKSLVERNISCSPELVDYLLEEYATEPLELDEKYKKALEESGVVKGESLTMLSEFFQLDKPRTRYAQAYMLTLFNFSVSNTDDICESITPADPDVRSQITIDIAAQEMKIGQEFSAYMADSLLEAVNHRCHEQVKLLNLP